ncbi:hypothetical protein I4U23_018661 [Adineta vaga]|nr:hypothetical protein I4U23_018661 [Adineta vaga]
MHWPFRVDIPNSTNLAPTISKSTAQSSLRDGTKSNMTPSEKDSINRTISYSRSTNLVSTNLNGKQVEMKNPTKSMTSEESVDGRDQHDEWNFKAQQGVITYQLPDNLPDGIALHNKLQKLMKTNTIYLNDRRFWSILENRFKILRKQNFQESMQRLRQSQQDYEQELISKGIMPSTTEQAIQQYAEQQRHVQITTNKINIEPTHQKKCSIDYHRPSKSFGELEAFESDNVHPRFHEIFTDYQFQTKSGKALGERYENNLHKSQIRVKTILPKLNQRDFIRQDLDAIKTSEGLYTYSNHLTKQLSK